MRSAAGLPTSGRARRGPAHGFGVAWREAVPPASLAPAITGVRARSSSAFPPAVHRPGAQRRASHPAPPDEVFHSVGGEISPLLSNIYLHVLDVAWERHGAHLGTLVRYADDFVVMSATRSACEQAEKRVREVLARLGLELHPDKTRRVDLSWGKEGFDFLGCHLRKRLSGPIWVRSRKRVYFLQRAPSQRSMKRVRQRVKELTGRNRNRVKDVRVLIRDLNPVLRGWGNYFRTGNAARKFNQVDDYVWQRLRRFLVKRKGRHLRAGEADAWTRDFFVEGHGLHRLRGTVQYPRAA